VFNYLALLGTATILIAGISAMFEEDIKKIIALSTLSQLGIIIIIVGLQMPLLAYYHLLSHAFFKAILFMCAGRIIHRIKDYQDIRLMGAGQNLIPLILGIIMVANLSLCGLPFMSGFYSKDIILECTLLQNNSILIFRIVSLSTLLTVAYSVRITLLLGFYEFKAERIFIRSPSEIWIPLGAIILFPLSIIGGYILR